MKNMVDIRTAIDSLKNGKTLLYPTDTIWGLGCDIANEDAIQRIKEIKKRSPKKSFILLVDSVAMLERYVMNFPDVCYDLIDFSSQPLTIIYEQPVDIPSSLLSEDGSVGIRVTKDATCRKLIQGIRRPIVSTSANISGEKTATCFAEIDARILENVDGILNERLDEVRTTPSKIIKIQNNGNIQLIR